MTGNLPHEIFKKDVRLHEHVQSHGFHGKDQVLIFPRRNKTFIELTFKSLFMLKGKRQLTLPFSALKKVALKAKLT